MEAIVTSFPLARAAGWFLLAAGLFFAISRLDGAREGLWTAVAFLAGAASATVALALLPSLGPPTALHWAALGIGIAIEVAGIIWANRRFAADARRLDIAILFIVGLHFLPMAYAAGPLMILLALACMALAALAWVRPALPMRGVGLADAAIKFGIGLALALSYPAAWPLQFQWNQ